MAKSWKDAGQSLVYAIVDPFIQLCIRLGITPNMITSVGLLLNIGAVVVLIYGAEFGDRTDHKYVFWAGLTILIAGLMDILDGRLARVGKMENRFGALYDSVLDRYSELLMFFGICYYLISHDYFLSSIFAFIAMIGSIMVSYTRARAEGLGVNASVGVMQRPERILLVGISAVVCGLVSYFYGNFKYSIGDFPIPLIETISFFTFPIFILAIMANVTAIRRLIFAKDELNKES